MIGKQGEGIVYNYSSVNGYPDKTIEDNWKGLKLLLMGQILPCNT